jgi:hypothetical protein
VKGSKESGSSWRKTWGQGFYKKDYIQADSFTPCWDQSSHGRVRVHFEFSAGEGLMRGDGIHTNGEDGLS